MQLNESECVQCYIYIQSPALCSSHGYLTGVECLALHPGVVVIADCVEGARGEAGGRVGGGGPGQDGGGQGGGVEGQHVVSVQLGRGDDGGLATGHTAP